MHLSRTISCSFSHPPSPHSFTPPHPSSLSPLSVGWSAGFIVEMCVSVFLCSSEGPLRLGSRPWPCDLTPEKRLVSGSECPVWPPCHSVCVCVWVGVILQHMLCICSAYKSACLCLHAHILLVCMQIFSKLLLCVLSHTVRHHVLMCVWEHAYHRPPHCVVGGRGAGPDETEVTGIDHRCCSQAKALSSLCALGWVLSASRVRAGERDNCNQCLILLSVQQGQSGFTCFFFVPDWHSGN